MDHPSPLERFRRADPNPTLAESLRTLAGFAAAMIYVGFGVALLLLAFLPSFYR